MIKRRVGKLANAVEASIGFVRKTWVVQSLSRIMIATGVITTSKFSPLAASNNVWNERSRLPEARFSRRAFINIGKSLSLSTRFLSSRANSKTTRYNTAVRYRNWYALNPGCGELSYSVLHFLPNRWIKLSAWGIVERDVMMAPHFAKRYFYWTRKYKRSIFLKYIFR